MDVGGTFTDVALVTAAGDLVTAKVPSTADQSEGVISGIQKACEEADIAYSNIEEFAHAMTVSVNALLERAGATTGLSSRRTAGQRSVSVTSSTITTLLDSRQPSTQSSTTRAIASLRNSRPSPMGATTPRTFSKGTASRMRNSQSRRPSRLTERRSPSTSQGPLRSATGT